MKRWYTRIVSLFLCAAIAVTLLPHVQFTVGAPLSGLDDDGVYHISSFNDLVAAAGYSRSQEGNKIKYVLENDISIEEKEMQSLKGNKIKHLSFGSKDCYFLGEFDGGRHTISGLNYNNVLLDPEARTGLFAFVGHTEGLYHASIHDLTLEGASIHADYCAGILAGDAYYTDFQNIRIVNSSLSVNPANNALVLITDGGAYGGALAGYAKNCTFYNCESKNTTVRANSVGGVAALSGKPLYMGGLVGEIQSSTVEYCRVMGGAVKNRYETSVGALGGFTCYAGGLAGQAGGVSGYATKFIDCFATCDVNFYAATYVGVAAGCSGHAGGLLGKATKESGGVMIKRCHYADGTISSYQYNTLLLMIPVQIADDLNRSGLVDVYEPSAIQVYDSYFNYKDTIGPKNGKAANVLGNKKTTAHYGPQADDRYEDRSFWENRGYDFAGNVDRSVEDSTTGPCQNEEPKPYANKWVMYHYIDTNGTERSYPVHGQSVAGTFDFPGAATVTLKPTLPGTDSLSQEEGVFTRDPYRFAVLGIYPTECDPVNYTDGTATKGGVSLSIAMNEGYRLVNWYLEPNVAAVGLPDGQHGYFEKIFADDAKIQADRLPVSNPNASYGHVKVADNQLYVARCEARVRFYDVNGGQVDVSDTAYPTENPGVDDDDWYEYREILPDVQPQTRPASPTATLIGWTTVPYVVGGVKQGYDAIDTVTLGKLRQDGAFYAPGSLVEKAMDLYPVYADLVSNVVTLYEGNELDGNALKTLREGYGSTSVTMEGNVATIHVTGALEDDAFPEGVRFLGWYELGTDSVGNATAHLVSRERNYTLTDVDLTAKHTYEARFEYRVRFWLPEKQQENNSYSQYTYLLQDAYVKYDTVLFSSEWESTYLANFDYNREAVLDQNKFLFSHWTDVNVKYNDDGTIHTYNGSGGSDGLEHIKDTAKYEFTRKIGAPLELYAIFSKVSDYFELSNYVTTDFPGSATVRITHNDADNRIVEAKVNSGYNYIFWDMYGKTANAGDGVVLGKYSADHVAYDAANATATWQSHNKVYEYRHYTLTYTAHMTADVNFHQAKSEELVGTPVVLTQADHPYLAGDKTVSMTRRYRSGVFGTADNAYQSYTGRDATTLNFNGTANGGLSPIAEQGAAPSREDMAIPGYYFVGWFEKAAWTQDDLDYFLDVIPGDGEPLYQSSSIGLCRPYVLADDAVVEHPMELYPVYVKYHIDSTTSVALAVEGVVNKPDDPIWAPNVLTEDRYELEVTAYNNVPVRPGGSETYTIEYVTVTVDGGEPVKLANTAADGGHWVVNYPVVPGRHYLFTAVYKPYVVVYHQYANVDTQVLVRNYGDPIGRPEPPAGQDAADPVLPTVQDVKSGDSSLYPELDHALFVGWTEVRPTDTAAKPYHFSPAEDGKTSYELAEEVGFWSLAETEDTIVTHSMELWPVFATYTVDVNSNIDHDLTTNQGYTGDRLWREVRSLDRTSANTVSTTVKAQEVEGYKFVGWYTGVELDEATGEYNDFRNATAISEAEEYTLEGSEPFTGKLYTARYKKVYEVIYHGRGRDGGPVIYTNYLYEGEDEDKALNKKVTETVKTPKLDENKEFVRDANGEIIYDEVLTTYHQPLDPVPYHMIYATMDSHESFGQWECHDPNVDGVNPNNELVNIYDPWSFYPLLPQGNPSVDFPGVHDNYQGLIANVGLDTRTINLYPTVWRVTLTDSLGNDVTDQFDVDIDMSNMKADYSDVKVYVCFDPENPYTQKELTVKVQRTRWVETEDPLNPGHAGDPDIALRGRNEVEIIPYTDSTRKAQLADSQKTHLISSKVKEDDPSTPENEEDDGLGYAVFTFGDGLLEIQKDAPTDNKNDTFLFQVTDANDSAKTWTVPVTCDGDATEVAEDGSSKTVGSRGSAFLSLPPGTYRVTELTSWSAHMKAPLYRVYVGGALREENDAHLTVPLTSAPKGAANATAKVICTNQPLDTGPQWLWKTGRKENRFVKTAGS